MEEIEVLQAIYPEEFVMISSDPLISFKIQIDNAVLQIEVDPETYPAESMPKISLEEV